MSSFGSGILDFIYDSEIFVDLYNVLEVEMDAKQDEIKSAYIRLAKKNHPDLGGSSDLFQNITRAYEILYNKETRKEYDLYYLKKSMDEFKGDDMIRMREDFKNFMSASTKPISQEELDKLYAEAFNDEFKKNDKMMDSEELLSRLNDVDIERQNMQIETADDTLSNFMKENGDKIKLNDVFEYLNYKNSCFNNNSIVQKEWGTLETMPGYSSGFSSFMDTNEFYGSNLYSNVSDMNTIISKETINNFDMNEFVNWKNTRIPDTKLSNNDIDLYLQKRQVEQEELFKEVETDLTKKSKRKEVEKFLKTKHLTEDIDKYYNELDTLNNNDDQMHNHKDNKDDNMNNELNNTNDLEKKNDMNDMNVMNDMNDMNKKNNILEEEKKQENKKLRILKSNMPVIIELGNNVSNGENTNTSSSYTKSDDIDGMLKFMENIKKENTENFDELEKELKLNSSFNEEKGGFFDLKSGRETNKINNVRKREFK